MIRPKLGQGRLLLAREGALGSVDRRGDVAKDRISLEIVSVVYHGVGLYLPNSFLMRIWRKDSVTKERFTHIPLSGAQCFFHLSWAGLRHGDREGGMATTRSRGQELRPEHMDVFHNRKLQHLLMKVLDRRPSAFGPNAVASGASGSKWGHPASVQAKRPSTQTSTVSAEVCQR